MTTFDWSQCAAVESIPGEVGGAGLFKDTRMPVATVFENFEAGLSVEDVMEEFSVTREQINAVLHSPKRTTRWLHGHSVAEAIPREWDRLAAGACLKGG